MIGEYVMSIKGFGNLIIKIIPTIKEQGFKKGLKYVAKQSVKEIGKVPSVFGIAGYASAYVLIPLPIPGTGAACAIGGALIGKGVETVGKSVIKVGQKLLFKG